MGFSDFWDQQVVSRLVRCGCGSERIGELRKQVVPRAQGRVFELGCGAGANQPFLDSARITAYCAIDPSPKLLDHARAEAARKGWEADIRQGVGEAIPYDDASFDTVVSTFTLCSVTDHARTLSEVRRILKPGGILLFAEHGRSPEPPVARWQERIDPLWRRVMGNCHLSRRVTGAINAAGFVASPMGREYRAVPKAIGWMEWGSAVRKD